jgi:hypothetical protein
MVQVQRRSWLKPAHLPPDSNGISHSTQTAGPVTATRYPYCAPVASGRTNGIAEPADDIVSLAEVSSKQAILPLWEEL